MLTAPMNGMITCSLGDDRVPTDGDTCSYTCNTGYVLSGSDMRTCESDGMWDDADPICIGKKTRKVTVFIYYSQDSQLCVMCVRKMAKNNYI